MHRAIINNRDMYYDFGLVMTDKKISTAVPNIYKQTVPGRNGDLDYTDFYGDITFSNRSIDVEFKKLVDENSKKLQYYFDTTINGREIKISFTDDPRYYWKGRCKIEENDDNGKIYTLSIKIDAYPKKFKRVDDTEVNVTDYV